MRILKLPLAGLLFCVMALFAGCRTSNEPKAPVALTWEMGASDIEPGYSVEGDAGGSAQFRHDSGILRPASRDLHAVPAHEGDAGAYLKGTEERDPEAVPEAPGP